MYRERGSGWTTKLQTRKHVNRICSLFCGVKQRHLQGLPCCSTPSATETGFKVASRTPPSLGDVCLYRKKPGLANLAGEVKLTLLYVALSIHLSGTLYHFPTGNMTAQHDSRQPTHVEDTGPCQALRGNDCCTNYYLVLFIP